MARVAAWSLVVAACHGGSVLPDAVVPDGPPACSIGGVVPDLARPCFSGWCMDGPAPIGHAKYALADGTSLWLGFAAYAYDGNLVTRIDGAQVDSFTLPTPSASSLVGTSRTGLWAIGYSAAAYFDGAAWTDSGLTGHVTALVPVAPGEAWAIAGGRLVHYAGQAWTTETLSLPDSVTTFDLAGVGASGPDDVWVSIVETATNPDDERMQPTWLAHRTAGAWTIERARMPVHTFLAFAPDDVWMAGTLLYHFDGATWLEHAAPPGDLFASGPGDLWALEPNSGLVSHFAGGAWTGGCTVDGLVSLSPRSPTDAWGTLASGTLAHFDGTTWAVATPIGELSDLAAIPTASGQDVLAIGARGSGGFIVRRADDGRWTEDASFPGVASQRLIASAPDDIWAVGSGAVHFDGASWTDTQPPMPLRNLCVPAAGVAIANAFSGFYRYAGGAWTQEVSGDLSGSSGVLYCTASDVWTGRGMYSLAHRVNGLWTWTPEDYGMSWTFSAASGQLWTTTDSVGRSLSRTVGPMWIQDPLRGFDTLYPAGIGTATFLSVAGTSASDIYAVFGTDVVHFDGTSWVSKTPVTNVHVISAFAPDDLALVHVDFTTERLHAGTSTTIASTASGQVIGYGVNEVWFASPTVGFAISDQGRFMKLSGSTWSVDTTFPGTYALHMRVFSASDVWVLADGTNLAHYNGSAWTSTALPGLAAGDRAVGMWGATTSDLWVASQGASLWRVTSGVPAAFTPTWSTADLPYAFESVAGTAANDVWFTGRHLVFGSAEEVLYHWDGAAVTRYRTVRGLEAIGTVAGQLLAVGWDNIDGSAVFQWSTDHWLLRTDLDPATVFPTLSVSGRPPFEGDLLVMPATGPWWATAEPLNNTGFGAEIWRHP